MNNTGTANKRTDESHHKIDRVIGGKNAQVAHSRPERVPGGQGDALLQVVFVREHAPFWPPTGAGGIHNASGILLLTIDEFGITLAPEFFPSECARQF